jgi:hypothetical protein
MKRENIYELGYLPKIEYWNNQLLNDNCDPDRINYIAEKIKYFIGREKDRQSKLKK